MQKLHCASKRLGWYDHLAYLEAQHMNLAVKDCDITKNISNLKKEKRKKTTHSSVNKVVLVVRAVSNADMSLI